MTAAAVESAVRLCQGGWDVGTVGTPIADRAEWSDPSTVKVVRDDRGGALYFSRAPIPYMRSQATAQKWEVAAALKHVGLYAFTRDGLKRATALPVHPLEELEGLEQLRWLAAGLEIGVGVVEGVGPGIDTEEDLIRAEEILKGEQSPL